LSFVPYYILSIFFFPQGRTGRKRGGGDPDFIPDVWKTWVFHVILHALQQKVIPQIWKMENEI
jgi:hypothetical protein